MLGEVQFTSLHNFCPLPVEITRASPDCYKFSAAYSKERERAIKQTLQAIDFAQRLGAPFVVLHCGEVEMNPITDELIVLAKRGELLLAPNMSADESQSRAKHAKRRLRPIWSA